MLVGLVPQSNRAAPDARAHQPELPHAGPDLSNNPRAWARDVKEVTNFVILRTKPGRNRLKRQRFHVGMANAFIDCDIGRNCNERWTSMGISAACTRAGEQKSADVREVRGNTTVRPNQR